jgi:hypothetical protein
MTRGRRLRRRGADVWEDLRDEFRRVARRRHEANRARDDDGVLG